ncbi:MAG: PfkB family carbohydrate kinase [Brachymonas sp.]
MPSFFACVGHASVDHHFEIDSFATHPTKTPATNYTQIVGGMAANAAIGLARLGLPVRLIGRVGSDPAGAFIAQAVSDLGIDSHLEYVAQAQSSVSSVIVDARGERQIFNHRGNALARAHALNTRQLQGAQAVLTDPRWGDGAAAALIWARKQGVFCMLDADVAPQEVLQRLVPLTQWAVFSEPGLQAYAPQALTRQDALRLALDAGAASAMVTLGERGVMWMHEREQVLYSQPSFNVKAVDTTGAGDVFHAALCFALSELGADHTPNQERQAIRFACAAAALKCTQGMGALGAPTRTQVQQFLDTQAA